VTRFFAFVDVTAANDDDDNEDEEPTRKDADFSAEDVADEIIMLDNDDE